MPFEANVKYKRRAKNMSSYTSHNEHVYVDSKSDSAAKMKIKAKLQNIDASIVFESVT